MEPNWEHIKREISGKEAPLSADAWKKMDGLLDANAPKKKAFYWWLLVLPVLLLTVPLLWLAQNTPSEKTPETEINSTIGGDKSESKSTPTGIKNNEELDDENLEESANEILLKVSEEVVQQKLLELNNPMLEQLPKTLP